MVRCDTARPFGSIPTTDSLLSLLLFGDTVEALLIDLHECRTVGAETSGGDRRQYQPKPALIGVSPAWGWPVSAGGPIERTGVRDGEERIEVISPLTADWEAAATAIQPLAPRSPLK
jgi:hypothetical protein